MLNVYELPDSKTDFNITAEVLYIAGEQSVL